MTQGPALTATLARYALDPHLGAAGGAACAAAKTGVVDTLAAALAAPQEPAVRIVEAHLLAQGGAAEAPLWHSGALLPSSAAACVNAVAGHALDYDDVAMTAHPSAVLVPVVLAEAHRLGRSGPELLRAYVAGYEVWAELYAREPDPYHTKGWHPTGVFGAVGAAAAAAHLNRLTPEQAQAGLAIAASMAAGLVANFGSMTKPLHAGRAAAAGIDAVRLAQRGLSASPDTLEHAAGFLAALSPHGRVDRDRPSSLEAREPRLLAEGSSIKRYPVCYSCHRVIDGAIALRERAGLSAERVEAVRVRIGPAQAAMLRHHRPRTPLEAKFSIEFAVAAAVVAGHVGLAELSDTFVGREDVRALLPKVAVEISETACPVDPAFALADRVWIRTTGGELLDSGEIRFALGHARCPLDAAGLRRKFLDCIAHGRTGFDGLALYERLLAIEALPDVRQLMR
jgi:2-methylcitrate dehydratase PrpD